MLKRVLSSSRRLYEDDEIHQCGDSCYRCMRCNVVDMARGACTSSCQMPHLSEFPVQDYTRTSLFRTMKLAVQGLYSHQYHKW